MHVDPEVLTLLALGEEAGSRQQRAHAQNCPPCSRQLAELHHVVAWGRSINADTTLTTPNPTVWTQIRDQLALDPHLKPPEPSPAPPTQASTTQSSTAAATAAPMTIVTTHEPPAFRHAQLRPVAAPWSSAAGTADVLIDNGGRRLLQVALHADLPLLGVRQAWLTHRAYLDRRQTLGILDGPYGLWTLDRSIDLREYPILHITQQSLGETGHSGEIIVEGNFLTAG